MSISLEGPEGRKFDRWSQFGIAIVVDPGILVVMADCRLRVVQYPVGAARLITENPCTAPGCRASLHCGRHAERALERQIVA